MTRWMGFVVLGALLAMSAAGCGKGKQEQMDANETTAGQLMDKAGEALQGATGLLAQQKDKLLAASQEQLANLEAKVTEWLDESGSDDEQVKQKLAVLRQQFQTPWKRRRTVASKPGNRPSRRSRRPSRESSRRTTRSWA